MTPHAERVIIAITQTLRRKPKATGQTVAQTTMPVECVVTMNTLSNSVDTLAGPNASSTAQWMTLFLWNLWCTTYGMTLVNTLR